MAASLRTRKISEFTTLPTDSRGAAIQAGNYFQTQDATGTPQTSPLSYSSSPITIVVPQGAILVSFLPTTDMLVSELSNLAQYDLIKANTKEVINCAQMANIYIQRSSADGSLYFKFTFV